MFDNIKHSYFDEKRKTGQGYRIVGELNNTDRVMKDFIWSGVYFGVINDIIRRIIDEL